MINKLFVYGTLAPGQSNEHLLKEIGGKWEEGVIAGKLYPDGIGPTRGFPAVDLEKDKGKVKGQVFSSTKLPGYWERLDDFEGEGYTRVITTVKLKSGCLIESYVYALDLNDL